MIWGASKVLFLPLKSCFEFCVFAFEALKLLAYIAYPWRFATIEFDFVSKILVFEIESWL